jgi:signal transduction histidine kinase
MLILIERLVLSRISSLNQSVITIREGKNFKAPVEIKGKDEIATFAAALKAILDELANSHRALKKANTELEARVMQRTQDLELTNETLKKEVFERKQVQAQLQQSRDQALDALQLKEQILANVSHDARTPLSVIILYTQMVQAGMYGDFTPKQANALQIILSNAQKMLTFVNNLLAESRAGAKKSEQLEKASFKPALLLKDIGTMFQPLAAEKKLQLTSSMSMDVPKEIFGDAERIRQIINNLVDNAIKFTPVGQIHVALYSQDFECLVIEVSDSGIGISAEEKDSIFDSFWQADGSITRGVNRGVGLGLSIVRKLTTLMDGTISVEAHTPNPGTTFKVTLPYKSQTELTI